MAKNTAPPKTASGGFTLIELMVTVAIVAILATIASAAYTSQVQKSRRTDARNARARFGRARGKTLQHHQRLQRHRDGPRLYGVPDRSRKRLLQRQRGGRQPAGHLCDHGDRHRHPGQRCAMRNAQRGSAGCAILHRDGHRGDLLGELSSGILAVDVEGADRGARSVSPRRRIKRKVARADGSADRRPRPGPWVQSFAGRGIHWSRTTSPPASVSH